MVQMVEARSFSGPLPPPDLLREYEAIVPGAAGRIFDMAQRQQEHRITLESTAIPAREKRANRGQWLAFIITVGGLGVAAFAVYEGQQYTAIAMGAFPLAILAGLFINANSWVSRSLRRKRVNEPPG
jgi:uncharacterized membrane protein